MIIAKTKNVIAQGATAQESRKALREALEIESAGWKYRKNYGYGDPVSQPESERLRKREVRDLMAEAELAMTVDDIDAERWEDDQYHAGFGRRSLSFAEVKIGRRRWHIEKYTDAEGSETITACPSEAMQSAASRSYRAGGGVRGLCMDHVRPDEVISLTRSDNLLEVLG